VSLVDEILGIPPNGGCCTTGDWYDQQDESVREAFDTYIGDVKAGRRKNYAPLYQVCCKHGLTISAKSFRDHIGNHVCR
jgi:hypothetical protein